jgi:Ni/Fe-hydrogenase 1 B-type cytochrome subunit
MAAADPPAVREARAAPDRRTVYVWELPVRIVHWVIVAALLVLSVTGYYLHHPFLGAAPGTGPGHPGFTMGTVRFVHETTGFVFTAAVLARVYWAFAGNRYAHWRAVLPITARQRHDLADTLRFYTFLRRRPPSVNGHNPLAALSYTAIYGAFGLSILSGLGLFAWVIGRPPWTTLFGWTYHVLSVPTLRLAHFLLMFVFIAFTVHHVYAAILFDVEERNGELSSIVTGWKASPTTGETPRDAPPETEP